MVSLTLIMHYFCIS